MATTFTGVRLEDKDNGLTKIGDDNVGGFGVGSLTVNGGDTLDLTNANLATQKSQSLLVGDVAGANGTVTIAAASTIKFTAVGDDTGTQLAIGRNGTGVMNIAGGTFQITDTSTVGFDTVNEDDEEIVIIGRNAGGNGQLNVSAGGSFLVEGNSVNMQIGRAGGTGSATFTTGSHFNLTAGGTGTDSSVLIRVGNNAGSVGTLSFDGSDGVLQANADNSAGFIIGLNGGHGDFQLLNGSTFIVNGGANGAGGSVGQGLGGQGTLTLDGASQLTFQQGSNFNGLNIGRNGGTGALDMTAGSTLTVVSQVGAYLNVGQDAGGLGTANVLNSTISLQGTGSGRRRRPGDRRAAGDRRALPRRHDKPEHRHHRVCLFQRWPRRRLRRRQRRHRHDDQHERRCRRLCGDRRVWRHRPGDARWGNVESQFRTKYRHGHQYRP